MALENIRIDEHPLGAPIVGDFFIFRDQTNGVTKKCFVDNFLPGILSQNFEWQPAPATYDTDDVVTRGGIWWQSTVDDNASIPGSPVTGDPVTWVAISRGVSWGFWTAGVYVDTNVFVLRLIGTQVFIFQLANVTRPFISADFSAELAAGDWKQLGSIESYQVNTLVSPFSLNFLLLREGKFTCSDDLAADCIMGFLNDVFALEFTWFFTMTGDYQLTLPASFKLSDIRWDSATKIVRPGMNGDFGLFRMKGEKSGADWVIDLSPSIFV